MIFSLPFNNNRPTSDTLALILAGGSGTRLQSLTKWHSKPAVPFGGKFRTIDFPLSNCLNSDIRRVGILTQYKSHSLNVHIQQGWSFMRPELGEFIELLPAQQRVKDDWYSGTANAVYQNLDIIRTHNAKYVLILAGDHIYKMDYRHMLQHHIHTNADMTVGCIEVPLKEATQFGVMEVDSEQRIVEFEEKPEQPKPLSDNPKKALASMGIYIFNTEYLCQALSQDSYKKDSSHDFGKDIIPSAIQKHHVSAYRFRDPATEKSGYWRDVGTIDSYYQTNLALLDITPDLNLYDKDWPIWTYQEQLPPAKFIFDDDDRRGMAVDSMVSAGCILSGSSVTHSLLFNNVRVNSYSTVKDSIILPNVEIGRNCKLKNVIIDQGCRIPPHTTIGYNLEEDRQKFYVSPQGVVLVSPEMLGQELYKVA